MKWIAIKRFKGVEYDVEKASSLDFIKPVLKGPWNQKKAVELVERAINAWIKRHAGRCRRGTIGSEGALKIYLLIQGPSGINEYSLAVHNTLCLALPKPDDLQMLIDAVSIQITEGMREHCFEKKPSQISVLVGQSEKKKWPEGQAA